MKKLVLGLIVGATVGYLIRKKQESGQFDSACDSASRLFNKSKEDIKEVVDLTKKKAMELKDQVKEKIRK